MVDHKSEHHPPLASFQWGDGAGPWRPRQPPAGPSAGPGPGCRGTWHGRRGGGRRPPDRPTPRPPAACSGDSGSDGTPNSTRWSGTALAGQNNLQVVHETTKAHWTLEWQPRDKKTDQSKKKIQHSVLPFWCGGHYVLCMNMDLDIMYVGGHYAIKSETPLTRAWPGSQPNAIDRGGV